MVNTVTANLEIRISHQTKFNDLLPKIETRKRDYQIIKMQHDGTHYFCDKKQSRSIRKSFEINGIPHYMLINKKGNVIEAGCYLRPMNSETISKIEKLLAVQ